MKSQPRAVQASQKPNACFAHPAVFECCDKALDTPFHASFCCDILYQLHSTTIRESTDLPPKQASSRCYEKPASYAFKIIQDYEYNEALCPAKLQAPLPGI